MTGGIRQPKFGHVIKKAIRRNPLKHKKVMLKLNPAYEITKQPLRPGLAAEAALKAKKAKLADKKAAAKAPVAKAGKGKNEGKKEKKK